MRLGGPVKIVAGDPGAWVGALRAAGYRAAYAPVDADADAQLIDAFRQAAQSNDIVIAETGAWSNPLNANTTERAAAMEKCKKNLALAEELGARCCVNIAGSRADTWDAPHADNFTRETFDLIVGVVREIIDDVNPAQAFYTLETMPWIYPDSAQSYQSLIDAIDRKQFGVHFDPVNIICSPQRYFENGRIIREFVDTLGPHIKSCHAKDIVLRPKLTVHLDEIRPGLGELDYGTLLQSLNRLDMDMPLMLEHLPFEQYGASAGFIRAKASEKGVSL